VPRLQRLAHTGPPLLGLLATGLPAVGATAVNGRLLTAREVADLLGVSPETVLRWTRRGELPAVKLPGGAVRYRQDELEQWLDARATVGDTGPVTKAGPGGVGAPTGTLTTGDGSSYGW
jgi:excisionase family DNA binding protein